MPDSAGEWIWALCTLIIGGILVNLISRKLERPFDQLYKKVNGALSARSQAKQQEIERIFNLMTSDSVLANTIYAKEMRARSSENTLHLTIITLFPSVWIAFQLDVILTFVPLLIMLLSMFAGIQIQNRRALLSEAINKYEEVKGIGRPKIL